MKPKDNEKERCAMKYKLKVYNIWEQGPREKQEDSIFPEYGKAQSTDRLFILCDGMGGHSAGEVASRTVCIAMSKSVFGRCPDAEGFFADEDFMTALEDAYDALDTVDDGAAKKMGTTLTFLKLHEKGATIAHIGDSRVYHIRPGKELADTEILFQTVDHSLVNDLVKVGELTPEEARHSKQKNVITRAMQPNMDRRCKADIYHTDDIKDGDYFMLCSDGILESMEDKTLKYIFSSEGGDDVRKKETIIENTKDNHDNHSAIIVHVISVNDGSEAFDEEVSEKKLISSDKDGDVDSNGLSLISENQYSREEQDAMVAMNLEKGKRRSSIVWRTIRWIIIVLIVALLAWLGYDYYINRSAESPSFSGQPVLSPVDEDNREDVSAGEDSNPGDTSLTEEGYSDKTGRAVPEK